ncbi:hypothetical protein PPL_02168 [Heterostelium album PN500]|uniref:Endo-beta-1,2-glucanase SGL domain-containing protein n=1 Tax=Heterostelium pallidum (strain ATCC 26659 / Pp 5 / PN500) TaxID=670386 RepID=D3B1J4_HETP5|nr:hypothetical protein PPL_02168 [Heterostelium album PN500]EFA85168.1 hypothetical protein PPL_02168 [Heterostelium album PN500]|eukprot:XP_020437277.1 hypothetical protein PPL_02168 [Heterostelium album PN500]
MRNYYLFVIFSLFVFIHYTSAAWNDTIYNGTCRFAKKYTVDDLLNHPDARKEFAKSYLHYEGNFHQHLVGLNINSAFTIDGNRINYTTGNITSQPRKYTAASKESLHLSVLAIGLNGLTAEGYDPLDFFHIPIEMTTQEKSKINTGDPRLDNVLVMLYRKMDTLEKFNTQYPGYGGFVSWCGVSDTGISGPSTTGDTVPSLDNGEMIWGIYAVQYLLRTKYPDHVNLGNRYRTYFNLLAANVNQVFLNTTVAAYSGSSVISNVSDVPKNIQYKSDSEYFLGDPYEGELFQLFGYLFGKWSNQTFRQEVWDTTTVRPRTYKTSFGDLTYQLGYTYSSHESWKVRD